MLLEHTAPFLPVYCTILLVLHVILINLVLPLHFLLLQLLLLLRMLLLDPNTWAYCLLSTSHSCGQLSAKLLRLEPRKTANLQLASGNVRPCNCIRVFDDVRWFLCGDNYGKCGDSGNRNEVWLPPDCQIIRCKSVTPCKFVLGLSTDRPCGTFGTIFIFSGQIEGAGSRLIKLS